ncbi:hypothetical protein ED733_006721 [Metarhizium rileyi]|uniref:Uncharacterized protein n=1 Tax=Metarhizium rileyi (strain RCEF 4871) TaxID=1649241 RepID=A0A5C6GHV2_METRR|nr:hypothetical protein ED733_006721 [Metarhizium rileyi]
MRPHYAEVLVNGVITEAAGDALDAAEKWLDTTEKSMDAYEETLRRDSQYICAVAVEAAD